MKLNTQLIPHFNEEEYCPEQFLKIAKKVFGKRGEWFNIYHSLLVKNNRVIMPLPQFLQLFENEEKGLKIALKLPVLMTRDQWDEKKAVTALESIDGLLSLSP